MPRYLLFALAAVSVALIAAGVVVGHKLAPGSTTPTATPTATISVPPPTRPVQRGTVHLAANYKAFVDTICRGLQHHNAGVLENDLEYYQYNQGVYWSPFNLKEGNFGSVDKLGQWLSSGREHCVRIAPSFKGHGVIASRGWPAGLALPTVIRKPYGAWSLFDVDKKPTTGAWTIDDFTFGTYRQVMGSFYGIEPRSVAYRARP